MSRPSSRPGRSAAAGHRSGATNGTRTPPSGREPIAVVPPKLVHAAGRTRVAATIALDPDPRAEPGELFFEIDRELDIPHPQDVVVAALLYPAMRLGRGLRVQAPLSARQMENLGILQDILVTWDPSLPRIPIEAPIRTLPSRLPAAVDGFPTSRGTATTLSGGVDSLHTIRTHREALDWLVHVRGFDTRWDDDGFNGLVLGHLRRAAGEIGLPLVEITTNLRQFTRPACPWSEFGGMTVPISLMLLSPLADRALVPASYSASRLLADSTHPLLDPRWSTDEISILQIDGEWNRVAKTGRIADWDVARRHLRVCWKKERGRYNCGRCSKCLRTMTTLRLLGCLEAFPAFERPLDLERLAADPHESPKKLVYLDENLALARDGADDPELLAILESIFARSMSASMISQLARLSSIAEDDLFGTATWRDRILPKARDELLDLVAGDDPGWLVERLSEDVDLWAEPFLEEANRRDPRWLRRRQVREWAASALRRPARTLRALLRRPLGRGGAGADLEG